MNPGTQQAYYIDRWIRDLSSNKPPVLLESLPEHRLEQQLVYYPEVKQHVDHAYQQITEVDGVKVYVLKERLQTSP